MIYQAFDFGDAALNNVQDRWAGYVRPRLGFEWTVVVSRMGQDSSEAETLPLPEGTQPGKIAWSGETLMILVNKDDRKVAFETTPKVGTSEWKPVGAFAFPGRDAFMLNKSETLEIDQVKEDGKPGVEVARVWFTGDRNVVAKIDGLTLRGCDLLGRFAFIRGEKAGEPAVFPEVWEPDNGPLLEDHALVTRLPGLHGRGEITILAASSTEGTWAATEYVASRQHAADLVAKLRLPSGRLPDGYQVVVRARFKDQVPIETSYVTHRVLQTTGGQ
jgi:hypothetical protein